MTSFDRKVGLILAGLGLLLAVVITAGQLVGLPEPELHPAGGVIGAREPLELVFHEALRPNSVEGKFALYTPSGEQVRGRLMVDDARIRFWPAAPLPVANGFVLRLESGVQAVSGLVLRRSLVWALTVRPAEVLYLSGVETPDLFRAAIDGSPPRQLTDTAGKVYDYSPAFDGSLIAYSAANGQNGIDLWEIDRDGGEPRLLLPCQADWCTSPAYSPDGTQIAYSRRQAGTTGKTPGAAHIWLLDLKTLDTEILYSDPNVTGIDPTWSPDGLSLAFFDDTAGGVRVLNFSTGDEILLPSNLGTSGSWSADGRQILYGDMVVTESTQTYVTVFAVDLESQQVQRVLGEDLNQVDYSPPAWSPDGEWVAVALRLVGDGPGKGLWRMRLDGSQREVISASAFYTVGAYSWDPSGEMLVYQSLEFGSSGSLPQVFVWRGAGTEPELLAEDAVFPRWLP